ncbi:MAG: hypothetical protein EAY75_02410 [Bacteroidetes bacterium]|nr:MAG: hypothetical protein EAY75_02410 [Bacteroidota bacterium]
MKLPLCLLLLCALHAALPGRSQSTAAIDSIEKLLPLQTDTVLCGSLNELTWLYRNANRQKAFEYGRMAIAQGNKSKYPKGVAQAWNDLGILYMDNQQLDSSILAYKAAQVLRETLKDTKGLAAVHLKMGIVHQKAGRFADALQQGIKALELYESINDEFGIASAANNVGIANQNVGNVDGAMRYHKRALALREKINDRNGLAASYLAVGNIYNLLKKMDSAIAFYNQSAALAEAVGNYETLATASHNVASNYDERARFSEGIDPIETAFSIREQLGDTKGMVSSLNVWGSLLRGLKRYPEAEQKLLAGLKLADTLESCLPEKIRVYLTLTGLYEAMGDYKKANTMARLEMTLRDSLFTQDMNVRFAEVETKYRTLENEQKIQEQQFAITKRNYWLGGGAIGVLLLGLLAYNSYQRFKLKKDKQLQAEVMRQQDLATKAVINAEEKERERIAGELHDGVGQLMSAARMNLGAFESQLERLDEKDKVRFGKIIDLVDESCKEVRAVSHQMMPNALLKRGLANAIRDFLEKLDTGVLKVDLYTEGLNERIDPNIEGVLYRVVQEAVNNVIKHSSASRLDLALVKEQTEISITIEDNGKGFDSSDATKFEGIGLKNIGSRIAFLRGTVEWSSKPNQGTLVSIHVPLAPTTR